MDVMIKDKTRGSMIGGAAGDALGYAVEFKRYDRIQKEYGWNGIQEYVVFPNGKSGVVSDDTQMTMFTACGLLEGIEKEFCWAKNPIGGCFPFWELKKYVAEAYVNWMKTQERIPANTIHPWLMEVDELYERRAPGNTCMNALKEIYKGRPYGKVYNPINNSKGCGGVMRAAPAGMVTPEYLTVEDVMMLGADVCAITHGHPLGWLPGAALAHIINALIVRSEYFESLEEILEETEKYLFKLYRHVAYPFVCQLIAKMSQAVNLSRNNDSDVENIREIGEGWVAEETLCVALYSVLRHEDDFEGIIRCAVNHDGDSDSTGAVAGNIAGAMVGLAGIPERWRRVEMQKEILTLANDIYNASDVLGFESDELTREEWKERYHR